MIFMGRAIMERSEITVGEYLLHRLKEIGVDHIFGVPGDFVLGLFNQILQSDVRYIGTCNELNAAYAADGYARIKGAGAFASTYAVGELSAINGVAGAFAERVPVVVITGTPSTIISVKARCFTTRWATMIFLSECTRRLLPQQRC
jgi:indolepyruvate decarboxylase